MIRHQTLAHQRQPESLRMIAQPLKTDAPIIVDEKHILPVVPALRHVVRPIRDNDPGDTS